MVVLALVLIVIVSSVAYTKLYQEGKKSEEQRTLEDENATEIDKFASNTEKETKDAGGNSEVDAIKDAGEEPKAEVVKETEDKPKTEPMKETEDKPETEPTKEIEDKSETEPTKETEDKPETEPSKDTEETPEKNEDEENQTTTETGLKVIETAQTVVTPRMLRAATYGATTTAEDTTIVKYFPVTLYDYDETTMNAATDKLDLDNNLTVREGFYFSGGSPEYTKTVIEADFSTFVAGEYYIQNIRAAQNREDGASWLQAHKDNKIYATTKESATVWTLSIENGEYYLATKINGETNYLVVGTNGDNDGYTTTKTPVVLSGFSGDTRGVQISKNGYYLCQWGSITAQDFGGYTGVNDSGNGMLFYPVNSETPVSPTSGHTYISAGYEEWNRWDKASGDNGNGDLLYTGLVRDELIDNEIVFNVNEGGIFDSNSTVKSIYEYVGLPFIFDATGYYEFNSDKNGVYFKDTDGDSVANPQSGTVNAPYNLHFAEGVPQPMPTDLFVGDGSTNAWFPFNAQASYDTSKVNYHFGMRADLPFSMTTNGRIQATDDNSSPITFSFSGDDDVWVFIDGHLVVDLGGIHNRLDVTVDFAENTVTYSEENSADTNKVTGSYNDSDFATVQKIFTDAQGQGLIDMTREVFATDDDHVMSVFYLERGKGTSNARIRFNLPMNDSVIITKEATQSWSEALEAQTTDSDGLTPLTAAEQKIVNNIQFGFTLYKKNAEGTFTPLANTRYQLIGRAIEGITFGSTDAEGHFYLKNGQSAKFITEIPSEGATYYVVEDAVPDGFVTPDFKYAGESAGGFGYYTPQYKADGITREDNAVETGNLINTVSSGNLIPEHIIDTEATENKSHIVTVYGSVEASDNIEFQCINFLNAEMPNPTATAPEDIIVLDYGLPVQIDPLANDVFRGDSIEIVYIGGPNVQVSEEKEGNILKRIAITENGNTVVDLNSKDESTPVLPDLGDNYLPKNNYKKFHFGDLAINNVAYDVSTDGMITRDTLTYTMNKPLTEVEVISYVVKVTGKSENASTGSEKYNYDYEVGKIYIVPATTMYYEENFTGLVKFANSANAKWSEEVAVTDSSAVSEYQEPGVVGTIADSTYGSDVAYLYDSGDSNGTSRFGSTENGPLRFAYTFTGTGTTIFARTSANTGYMQIKLYEGTTSTGPNYKKITYRDTYYKDTNSSSSDDSGTLYNIPVYTEEKLPYGIYTVVVTIAKAGTPTDGNPDGSGSEFYLDGIRIMEPLNKSSANAAKALSAYATDGESNMKVVNLRDKMITDAEEEGLIPWNFVVMTDSDGEIKTAEDYISIGPKEEVYLDKGQSISFGIKYWHKDGYKLYMGMKAPMGKASVKSGANTKELTNATDCYFDITEDYTSVLTKNDQSQPYYVAVYTVQSLDKIVSLTNIKAVGNYSFVLVENVGTTIDDAENDEVIEIESGETNVVKQKVNTACEKVETDETVEVENDEAIEREIDEVVEVETIESEIENSEVVIDKKDAAEDDVNENGGGE